MYGGPPPRDTYGDTNAPYMSYTPGPPPQRREYNTGYAGAPYDARPPFDNRGMPPPPPQHSAGRGAMSPHYGNAMPPPPMSARDFGAPGGSNYGPPSASSGYSPLPPPHQSMQDRSYGAMDGRGGMPPPAAMGPPPGAPAFDPYYDSRGLPPPHASREGPPGAGGWNGGPQRSERRRSASPPAYGGAGQRNSRRGGRGRRGDRNEGSGPGPGYGSYESTRGPPGRGRDDRGYDDAGPPMSRGPPPAAREGRRFDTDNQGDDYRPHGRFTREGRVLSEREHESLIQERIEKERPRRTLFVRNVKYGTSPDEVRGLFERIGDIKDFHDLLEKRGMAFITFYDIRAAMMAKDQLQDYQLGRRSIDVHYSLPRDNDLKKPPGRDSNQGTLSLIVEGARGPITDQEMYARFGPFGDIRGIMPDPMRSQQRLIEFFDSRATESAYDSLNGQPMVGGIMDLRFEWDAMGMPSSDMSGPPPRGAAGAGSGYGRDRPPSDLADRPPMRFAGPPVPAYGSPPAPVPAVAPPSSSAAPVASIASIDERLQQALKAQQLLAALGQGANNSAAGAPATNGLPPPPPGFAPPPPGVAPVVPTANGGSASSSALPPALAALMPSAGSASATTNGAQSSSSSSAQAPAEVQNLLNLLAAQNKQQQGAR
ncbi:hypothetical protein OIO90_003867 [Microbotryomycetes sp. JL221]|nr:hypothetical protein OIO90_003867 [Microbotryomycetes sp. JL221]